MADELVELGVTRRLTNLLARRGVDNWDQLEELSIGELCSWVGIGPASVDEITVALAKKNVRLPGTDEYQHMMATPIRDPFLCSLGLRPHLRNWLAYRRITTPEALAALDPMEIFKEYMFGHDTVASFLSALKSLGLEHVPSEYSPDLIKVHAGSALIRRPDGTVIFDGWADAS
jgi:DNA-directed RNA polymerase alpha subunit